MRQYLMAAAVTAVMGFGGGVGAAPVVPRVLVPQPANLQLAQAIGLEATVRVDSANLRAAPDQKSKVLRSVKRGAKVQVVSQMGDWTRVRVGTLDGYISRPLLSR